MRAIGWVRVRLIGNVTGRRLDAVARAMKVRNVLRGGTRPAGT